jgi:hypothetical protein
MLVVLVGALVGATALAENSGRANGRGNVERHPKIHQAITALQSARGDLQNAAHDFCGHRVEALEATNYALKQLQLALESDQASLSSGENPALELASYTRPLDGAGVTPGNGSAAGNSASAERHPLIRRAINALDAARTDLQQAAHDFKGHRAEALEAINRAQNQLRQALACDKD